MTRDHRRFPPGIFPSASVPSVDRITPYISVMFRFRPRFHGRTADPFLTFWRIVLFYHTNGSDFGGVSVRSIPLFSLLILPFFLSAAIRSETGQWRADGRARDLYATSLGRLYQIPPNQGSGASIGCQPPHENFASCNCDVCTNGRIRITSVLSLKMPGKIKITNKTRYIALDFRIRVFPALEKKGGSRLHFALLDSSSPISGSMHFDLHGRKIIDEYRQDDRYHSGQAPVILGRRYRAREFIHPAFEPLSLRVVYDLIGKKMTYFMNGREFEYPAKIHGTMASLQLRYFRDRHL